MKIRCIAVDDEPLALDKMKGYILRVGYLELLDTFDNGLEAIEFIKTNPVDLIFLDIQMEELTGIQMLEAMNEKPKVILTTAYHEYAIKGYELDVCDYLLKPISFQRFLQACEKVHDQLAAGRNIRAKHAGVDQPGEKSYIFVKNGNITQKVIFSEILFVEGMKDYLRIHTTKERVMTLLSFIKLGEALPSSKFMRIHKSYLISLDKIEKIERNHVMIGDKRLPIGDSYRRQFFKEIEKRKIN